MGAAITITAERVDEIIRLEAARLVGERIAAVDVAKLAPSLDWRPTSWFAEQWGLEPKAFNSLARKLRFEVSPASRKTKLYSVADVNAKTAARASSPPPRRKARIT